MHYQRMLHAPAFIGSTSPSRRGAPRRSISLDSRQFHRGPVKRSPARGRGRQRGVTAVNLLAGRRKRRWSSFPVSDMVAAGRVMDLRRSE
jgi:hypothetical protein